MVVVIGIVAYFMTSKSNTGATSTTVTKTGGGAGLLQGISGFFGGGIKKAASTASAAQVEQTKKDTAQSAMQIGSMFY